jgi:homoserine dehydrogenase
VPLLGFQYNAMRDTPILDIDDVVSAYYLRMEADDKPGVLAVVSDTFAKHSISIEAVLQKEPATGESSVHLIMLTQKCVESNVNRAIKAVEGLGAVLGEVVRIRVEHLD